MRRTSSEIERELEQEKQFRRYRPRSSARISENISYPTGIVFIICNELCERFTFYGVYSLLGQYLKAELKFSDRMATLAYHSFVMFCYFFPIMGGIIADCWLGKYATIIYLSLVYAAGDLVMTIAAVPGVPSVIFALSGLVLVAIGAGCIKPCVASFGGDQFLLPEQESHIKKYFSIFYFTINVGSFISFIVAPLLRHVHCFGEKTCYTLAYGVFTLSMLTALGIFLLGTKYYKRRKPDENIILKVLKCIMHALRSERRRRRGGHWLDKAADKYNPEFIEEVKHTLRLLILYIPLPFFWALFDQQGSRWAFQASRMNGDIGNTKLHPSQIQTLNPILILMFIPLFEAFVYPTAKRYNLLTKPLQRLTAGGLLAALAFVVSAIVEYKLEETYVILPKHGEGQLKVYNGLPQVLHIQFISPPYHDEYVPVLGYWKKFDILAKGESEVRIKYGVKGVQKTETLVVVENSLTSYAIMPDKIVRIDHDEPDRSIHGDAKVMVVYSQPTKPTKVTVQGCGRTHDFFVSPDKPITEYDELLDCNLVLILVDGKLIENNTKLQQGGNYVILILDGDGTPSGKMVTVVPPNSVHMLWLAPQYILLTAGEVMFSITGLEFSYTQAPATMKTLLQATWLLTIAFGNLIVGIVAQTKVFERQLYEFLLFAGLMVCDMFIFALMTLRYQYTVYPNVDATNTEEEEDTETRRK